MIVVKLNDFGEYKFKTLKETYYFLDALGGGYYIDEVELTWDNQTKIYDYHNRDAGMIYYTII